MLYIGSCKPNDYIFLEHLCSFCFKPGLSSAGGGKYNISPTTGNEVVIDVTGTLPDGSKVSDKKTFRIKGIPSPTGTIREKQV
jgi:hypothetical protein